MTSKRASADCPAGFLEICSVDPVRLVETAGEPSSTDDK
jgi:hypothetical protein